MKLLYTFSKKENLFLINKNKTLHIIKNFLLSIAITCCSFLSVYSQTGEALDFAVSNTSGSGNLNNYVNLPILIPTSTLSYTKEAWIRLRSYSVENLIISGSRTAFWAPGGLLSAGHNPVSTNLDVQDGTPIPLNTWTHVADRKSVV